MPFSMRRALAPRRSETRLDNLRWASSSSASSRFWSCTRLITRQLIFVTRYRPPQTLLPIGNKAQGQLTGDQPLHQAFGVGEVVLAPPRSPVRLRLRQMQSSQYQTGIFPLLAERFPVPFQGFPDWLPVLCRRFHHHFLHLLLEQPG